MKKGHQPLCQRIQPHVLYTWQYVYSCNKKGTIVNILRTRVLNWWIYAAHLHFDTIPRYLAAFGGVAFSWGVSQVPPRNGNLGQWWLSFRKTHWMTLEIVGLWISYKLIDCFWYYFQVYLGKTCLATTQWKSVPCVVTTWTLARFIVLCSWHSSSLHSSSRALLLYLTVCWARIWGQ